MTTVTLRIKYDGADASRGVAGLKAEMAGAAAAAQKAGAATGRARDELGRFVSTGKGAEAAARGIAAGMQKTSEEASEARAAVAGFVAALASIESAKVFVRIADEMQAANDRLRLVTSSTAEFADAQQQVFAIAQQTGSAIGSVTDLYSKLDRSLSALGATQSQVATITQAITQSFVISGAGAAEADTAIRQLAQGLASGALRGDELNSVLENSPRLAKALADALGVTVGQLREMGAQGQITADLIANGLLGQAPAIAAEFDAMGVRVSQAWTQVTNATAVFISRINESSGATSSLAGGLSQVAGVIENVAGLFTSTGQRSAAASQDVGLLARTFQVLAAVVATAKNAIEAAVNVIAGAIAALSEARAGVARAAEAVAQGSLDLAQRVLAGDWAGVIRNRAEAARRALDELGAGASRAGQEIEAGLGGASAEVDELSRAFDAIFAPLNQFEGVANSASDKLRGVASASQETAQAAQNAAPAVQQLADAADAFAGVTGSAQAATEGMNEAIAQTPQAMDAARQAAEEFARYWSGAIDAVSSAFGDWVASGARSFSDLGRSLKSIAQRIISDLVAQFVRSRIVIPVAVSLTGGAGGPLGGLLQAAGGGRGGLGSLGGLLGGGGGFLGSLFSASGAGTAGGAFAGATAGATAGIGGGLASLAGPIGAAIAAVSVLTSLFRQQKPPDIRLGGSNTRIRSREGQFSTAFGNVQAGSRQISFQSFQQPLAQFDEAIQQLVRSVGGGEQQLQAIAGALANWSVDLRGSAATVENVLGSRFNAILSTFSADVQAFVGTAGTVEERIARLGEALNVQSLAGLGDLGSDFQSLLDTLNRVRNGNEDLSATYERLMSAVSTVRDAAQALGTAFDGTSADAAAFAAGLLESFGSLEALGASLQAAFAGLFSAEEIQSMELDRLRRTAERELGDIGLSLATATRENLRELLRSALSGALSPEQAAQIIQAASAWGAFQEAVADAAQPLQTLQSNATGAAQGTQDLSGAIAEYQTFIAGFQSTLDSDGLSDFQRSLQQIQDTLAANIQRANELARAAGMQGASEEDLARIHEVAAREAARAIAALEDSISQLAEQLGYLSSPELNGAFSSIEDFVLRFGDVVGAATQAAQQIDPQRFSLATQLGGQLRELAEALGEPLLAVADRLRVPLDRLVTDLGVNLQDLGSSESFDRLVSAARLLGEELPTLAETIGASIGRLTDADSLLNNAFERAINQLPDGVRESLAGLLRDVETAQTPEQRAAAVAALEAAVNALAPAVRAALAPFLEGVDTTSVAEQQVAAQEIANQHLASAVRLLGQIANSLAGTNTKPPPAVGDPGSGGAGKSGTADPMLAELRQIRAEVAGIQRAIQRGSDKRAIGMNGAA